MLARLRTESMIGLSVVAEVGFSTLPCCDAQLAATYNSCFDGLSTFILCQLFPGMTRLVVLKCRSPQGTRKAFFSSLPFLKFKSCQWSEGLALSHSILTLLVSPQRVRSEGDTEVNLSRYYLWFHCVALTRIIVYFTAQQKPWSPSLPGL